MSKNHLVDNSDSNSNRDAFIMLGFTIVPRALQDSRLRTIRGEDDRRVGVIYSQPLRVQ